MQYWCHLWPMANTIFSPRITGLKSENAWLGRSTPLIPRLYAAIMADCWIFCFLFSFLHLFALPVGCTPYALFPIVTKESSFCLIIWMLPSPLKWKDPLSIFFFRSKRCYLLDFYKIPKHFWQQVYPKGYHYFWFVLPW